MSKKPWMVRRPGETERAMNARLALTCYGCGSQFSNMRETDEHEKQCSKTRDHK